MRSSDGQVTQMLAEKDIGIHAGNSYYNATTVAIEHEAFVRSCTWYTDAMYRSSARHRSARAICGFGTTLQTRTRFVFFFLPRTFLTTVLQRFAAAAFVLALGPAAVAAASSTPARQAASTTTSWRPPPIAQVYERMRLGGNPIVPTPGISRSASPDPR